MVFDKFEQQAILNWAVQKLSEAQDIVQTIDAGEQCQFIRVNRGGAGDQTRDTYLKALRDITHLELLIETLDVSHPSRETTILSTASADAAQASQGDRYGPD